MAYSIDMERFISADLIAERISLIRFFSAGVIVGRIEMIRFTGAYVIQCLGSFFSRYGGVGIAEEPASDILVGLSQLCSLWGVCTLMVYPEAFWGIYCLWIAHW